MLTHAGSRGQRRAATDVRAIRGSFKTFKLLHNPLSIFMRVEAPVMLPAFLEQRRGTVAAVRHGNLPGIIEELE